MNKKFNAILLILAAMWMSFSAQAQESQVVSDPAGSFKTAKELFQKGQYSLAYPMFIRLDDTKDNFGLLSDNIKMESRYYRIICGLETGDPSSETSALIFLESSAPKARLQMMSYHLGSYYFHRRDFENAVEYYTRADIDNLTNGEIASMSFNKGYALFTMQRFDEARPLFDAVRQLPNDSNYIDANYYFGFISFMQKKFDDALTAFKVVEHTPEYQFIVPFYIAEIDYFQGNHDEALRYGEDLVKQGGQYYDLPLRQLVGHLYFDKKQYDKARVYLEQYISKADQVHREDIYELSYCYYAAGDWAESVQGFKQLGGKEDSLSQSSMYLLANAYLKMDKKEDARNAFLFCASNATNLSQKEVSLFNYAKLSFELGYMDMAQSELESFIKDYPQSSFYQEARELEINVLTNTSNYRLALEQYQSLPHPSDQMQHIYPGILYGRAVELINDHRTDQAGDLLDKLLESSYNRNVLPLAYFWKGELEYRVGHFEKARDYLVRYLDRPIVFGEVNSLHAIYNLGYALLRLGQYQEALRYFQKVSSSEINASSSVLEMDAYLRAADCYYMLKNYRRALRMYDNLLINNVRGADYALYQKAIIAGAMGESDQKIALLNQLYTSYPNSYLNADANMQMAVAYMSNEKFQDAIVPLKKVLETSSATASWPDAYMQLGVTYYNLNKYDESLASFGKLIDLYPNSDQSNQAIDYIRNIFVSEQKPDDFITFMKKRGKIVSFDEADSLSYASAEQAYENNTTSSPETSFQTYLDHYPQGRYRLDADWYLADIFNSRKNYAAAFPHYESIAAKAPNKYAESSVLACARILYFYYKDYKKAEIYFKQLKDIAVQEENKLEAMRGLLRCQYKNGVVKEALSNASDLLSQPETPTDDRMMAELIVAKNKQADGNMKDAELSYRKVISLGKSEYSAEAQYRLAELLFDQDKLDLAEKAGFEEIRNFGSYDLWVTRSYILLGDIYFKRKDYFNAAATFKSVAENAALPELKKEAQQKLILVNEAKGINNKLDQQ